MAEIARAAGALVIFDAVISFRLGHSGAQGLWGRGVLSASYGPFTLSTPMTYKNIENILGAITLGEVAGRS